MKAVLMSIKPKWCEKIFNGEKTIEVRKTAPKLEPPFKVYVYCTKEKEPLLEVIKDGDDLYGEIYHGEIIFVKGYRPKGKVIGEFVCDRVIKYGYDVISCAKFEVNGAYVKEENRYNAGACLSAEEMYEYSNGKPLYGWHITKPKRYDTPKELGEFYTLGNCEKYDFCNQCKNFHRGQGWLDGSYYDEDCCLDNTRIPVTRAPQSWQYVEE